MFRRATVMLVSSLLVALVAMVVTQESTREPRVLARLDAPELAHQGHETVIRGRVASKEPARVVLHLGDGTVTEPALTPDGRFVSRHTYTAGGRFRAQVVAMTSQGISAASTTVEVAPRVVLFVQGVNSQSACPDGRHFLEGGPTWISETLRADGEPGALILGVENFRYFSYSGRFCSDGHSRVAIADYDREATCDSIGSVLSLRLRQQIETYSPSRVTVIAHSMGGVLAAYAIGADPEWAAEHIASVATFDSPLGGVDGMRAKVFERVSERDGGCDGASAALKDMHEGSEVLGIAARAAAIVPFFTLDGGGRERGALYLAEAVPGDVSSLKGAVLAWSVGEAHSEVWRSAAQAGDRRGRFVVCAVLVRVDGCG